jgi:site-specific recombinase XerD
MPRLFRITAKNNFRTELSKYDSVRPIVLRWILNFNSPNTRTSYSRDLFDFFDYFTKRGASSPSNFKINEVEDIHILAYKAFIVPKYAKRSVNRKIATLSSFFIFAEQERIIDKNPARRIKRLAHSADFTTKDINNKTIRDGLLKCDDSKNIRHAVIMYLFLYSGLRCSEAMSITFDDIVTINNEDYFKVITKGGKERTIFIHPILGAKISDFKLYLQALGVSNDHIDGMRLIQSNGSLKNNINHKSATCSIRAVYIILRKYLEQNTHPHMCRVAVISGLISNKAVNIFDVSQLVGHESVAVTEKYYRRKLALERCASRQIDWGAD